MLGFQSRLITCQQETQSRFFAAVTLIFDPITLIQKFT